MTIIRETVSQVSSTFDKLAEGKVYTLVFETEVAGGTTFDLCVKTDILPISILSINLGTTSLQTTAQIREGIDFTDLTGTPLVSFNRNRNFKTVPFPVNNAESNPTVTDDGSLIEQATIYGQSGTGSFKNIFSEQTINLPYITEPNENYMFRFINNDNSNRNYRVVIYLTY